MIYKYSKKDIEHQGQEYISLIFQSGEPMAPQT